MQCTHRDKIVPWASPSAEGCEECLRLGSQWVHLRMCLTCGKVGCCDSSPNRHASKHAGEVGHPIVRSMEPYEDWAWCFVDQFAFDYPD